MNMRTPQTAEYARSENRKTPGRRPDRRAILSALAAAIGLVAVALAVFPRAQVQLAPRKVSGTVVAAATQQPVQNARVLYEETGQPSQTTATDAKGYFEVPAGRLGVVTVKARGFGTARRRWPPRSGTQLRIELVPPAIVSGTVTDLATGRLLPARLSSGPRPREDVVPNREQGRIHVHRQLHEALRAGLAGHRRSRGRPDLRRHQRPRHLFRSLELQRELGMDRP